MLVILIILILLVKIQYNLCIIMNIAHNIKNSHI